MRVTLSAGERATPADRRIAQERQRLFRDELSRVREAALAWRNGLAGLLAGMVGFGLIRGRNDVNQLRAPWDLMVGVLLLVALILGVIGAMFLLTAAHGRPRVTNRDRVRPESVHTHMEAIRAAYALQRGTYCGLLCASLLVGAVAVTWYGPAKAMPVLEVNSEGFSVCGSVVRVSDGMLTVRTPSGETSLNLRAVTGFRPLETCPRRP